MVILNSLDGVISKLRSCKLTWARYADEPDLDAIRLISKSDSYRAVHEESP